MRVLIVRLSSLGDVVHTIPVAAALRRHRPDARIDWVVDEACADLLTLVPVIDRRIVLRSHSRAALPAWRALRRELRDGRYDVALDVQGLGKSALVARLSGARRVIGFADGELRERWAGRLYRERADPGAPGHVMTRNLGILTPLGITDSEVAFPIELPQVATATEAPVVLLNPNSAWSTKCWPADRYGALAAHLRETHGLGSLVLWGPGASEAARADAVVAASSGAAVRAPATTLVELTALLDRARLVVAGDTGPLHLAAALGTPVLGIYGPSDPARNGPWSLDDEVVSAFDVCRCYAARGGAGTAGHMVRRCEAATWCLDAVTVDDVCAAADRRLATSRPDA